jgi:lysophospholipase L1-like esterase
VFAQVNMDYEISKFNFVQTGKNYIHNNESLNNMFEKLYLQKVDNNKVISIIHIGDSHLQADFITSVIRTTLQAEFGNAGRGLIVPLKVARTNEPFNFVSSSPVIWQSKRCVFPKQSLPIGIGGVTISNDMDHSSLNIKTFDAPQLSYTFNKLKFFYLKDDSSYDFIFKDSVGNDFNVTTSQSKDQYPNSEIINLPYLTHQVSIEAKKTNDKQSHAVIFGISLENNNSGILYHTIGVNGARFKHYTQALYFSEQTKVLEPDLFILSLGTNEANDANYNDDEFYGDIHSLYVKLRSRNPQAVFLLTTPADSYYQKIKSNPRMASVASTIICFATENNIAYWDLQDATGGKNSAHYWKQNKLLGQDGVHYTSGGYTLQGNLFCKAFLNAYNTYVSNRPK